MKKRIQAKIIEFEKSIKQIENKGCGLQGKEYKRTCGVLFCKDCHEIGVLYIKNNLLKELLEIK